MSSLHLIPSALKKSYGIQKRKGRKNMYSTINKGDMVYYARIQKKNGTYDLCELKVRTVGEDYFCGMDKKDRHVYLFGYNALGDYVFQTRKEALDKIHAAEKNKVEVSEETYYEEYWGECLWVI